MRALNRRVLPVLAVLLVQVADARAQSSAQSKQESLAGAWQAGATTMDVAIQSWGPDCGPRPQSSRSAGGGRVEVEQTGDLLVIKGRNSDVRSDRCLSPNPAVKKVGSSHKRNTWITRCKTTGGDPKQEQATYTIRLEADGRLFYEDVSSFDWKLKDSACIATITTRQTLQRTGAAPAPTATPTQPGTTAKPGASGTAMPNVPPPGSRAPTPPPPGARTQATPTCVPGKPSRLSLRPRRADLELGQRTCFEARVTDAKGCAVSQPAVTWSLDHKPGIRARLEKGCFRAEEGSAEGEGAFQVTAAFAGLHAAADVEVSASTLPALIARRMEGGAIEGETPDAGATDAQVVAAPPPVAIEPKAPAARVVARTVAVPQEDNRGSFRMAAIAAGVAAFALLFATMLWRMVRASSSRRGSIPSEPPTRGPAKTTTMSLRCPRCGAFYPEGSAFCGNDGSSLEPK
ncbi:MAG TPA: hypothetical protein VK509_15705 [Polyangiales bacterium]|nr:hypothetical protein [Polyangiales bacterium]